MRTTSDNRYNESLPAAQGRSGLKAIWPCLALAAPLAVYGLFIRHGVAASVVGYNLAPSERVMHGEAPYRDFIYNYTPGVLWLNALAFRLLGTNLIAAHLVVFAAKTASVFLLYFIARRYLPHRLALLPLLATLAWLGIGDILKPFPTQYGLLLIEGTLMALLAAGSRRRSRQKGGRVAWKGRAFPHIGAAEPPDQPGEARERAGQQRDRAASRGSFALRLGAGFLCGLVFLLKQNVGVFVLAAAAATIAAEVWETQRGNGVLGILSRRVGALAAGFAVCLGPAAIYLATQDALRPMLSHFLHHAAAYEEAKGIALPSPVRLALCLILAALWAGATALLAKRDARRWAFSGSAAGAFVIIVTMIAGYWPASAIYESLLANAYYLPLYCGAAGVLLFVIFPWRGIIPQGDSGKSSQDRGRWRKIGLALFAGAAFMEIFPRSDADHLIRALPVTFLLVVVLAHELASRGGAGARWKRAAPGGAGARWKRAAPGGTGKNATVAVWTVVSAIAAIGVRATWEPQFQRGLHFQNDTALEFERGLGMNAAAADADRLNKVVAYVQQATRPGDPIFASARRMTSLYFLADRRNPTRMLWFDSAGIPGKDREALYRMLAAQDIKLVAVGGDAEGVDSGDIAGNQAAGGHVKGQKAIEAEFLSTLRQWYRPAAVIDGITIFVPAEPAARKPVSTGA